jgi:hypothetical protein
MTFQALNVFVADSVEPPRPKLRAQVDAQDRIVVRDPSRFVSVRAGVSAQEPSPIRLDDQQQIAVSW